MRGTQIKQADEVRVFAHDAKAIVIGATDTFEITVGGFGYVPGDIGSTLTATTGTPALTATIDAVTSGSVSAITITNPGGAYNVGDILSFTGGTGASFRITVTSINIPGTENRGACLYAGTAGNIEVEMESGETATFNNVPAGTFMPILVKRLVAGTDVLALY